MNPIWDEAVPEREHLHHRTHPHSVAEVIGVDTACKRRTRGGLSGDEARVRHSTLQLVADERVCETGEVRATTDARDHNIRVLACHLHLLFGLETHHGLVEQYMVDDGPERVLRVVVSRRVFDGF